jgi:error-prone DNA polymerase
MQSTLAYTVHEIARVRQLTALKRPVHDPSAQLDFDIDHSHLIPRGNAEFSVTERIQAELSVLDLDVSGHILERYRPLLDELGVTPACELLNQWNRTEVLVAGIRVATQTPPMRSGKRVVFVTLDDGTGCSDSTFFDEAQARCSHILFNTRLLVIAGKTRRTGVNGVSLMAENAWDVRELYASWQQARANKSLIDAQ